MLYAPAYADTRLKLIFGLGHMFPTVTGESSRFGSVFPKIAERLRIPEARESACEAKTMINTNSKYKFLKTEHTHSR